MKKLSLTSILIICLATFGCSKVTEPVKNLSLGNRLIDYQADNQVDTLIIPPDLTSPNFQGEYSEKVKLEKNEPVIQLVTNVEVMRDNYRRWLLVESTPDEVWAMSKDFFRSYGFKIEKENKKIGIFETNYLEIETVVPEKSLGFIRAALSKALKTQYGLPIADKYRIRVEPTENSNKTEVYLTLSSIGEVVNGSMRVWQPREKDVELETEMLLKLMVFLGDDRSNAITKIKSNTNEYIFDVSVILSEKGYATLNFPFEKRESWKLLGWALDELSIDVEDRDQIEGSYLINVTPNKGFFSKILATASLTKTYQLILKEDMNSQTKVIFVDLSEENDEKTISYSAELFDQIASKF